MEPEAGDKWEGEGRLGGRGEGDVSSGNGDSGKWGLFERETGLVASDTVPEACKRLAVRQYGMGMRRRRRFHIGQRSGGGCDGGGRRDIICNTRPPQIWRCMLFPWRAARVVK